MKTVTSPAVAAEVHAMHLSFVALINRELAQQPAPKKEARLHCECCTRPAWTLGEAGMCMECDDLAGIEEKAMDFGEDALTDTDKASAKALMKTIRKLGGKPQFEVTL